MSFFVLLAAVGCNNGGPIIFTDSSDNGEDLECPHFEHIPVSSPQTIGQDVPVSANITDDSGVLSAVLYYKIETAIIWKDVTMKGPGDNYSATIPGIDVTGAGGMHYYLWAQDASPALNACTLPNDGEDGPFHFTIDDAVQKDSG
jgi:hypothetical protein